MTKIKFKRFIFHDGTNVTVRTGRRLSIAGMPATLESLDGDCLKAHIYNCYYCRFDEIPARLVEMEHDPICQTYSGLLKTMKDVYPRFTERDYVTCVEFGLEPEME